MTLERPNLRKMFVPDPGYTLIEFDLKGADARVVAWEADDESLKRAFRAGVDIHAFNAETIWKIGAPLSEYKTHPRLKPLRVKSKTAVHAVNYYCKERTLAIHLSESVSNASLFISNWFQEHPGIQLWHKRIEKQLLTTRTVTNKFSYQRRYFDRPDNLLPEALAWIGQSTTSIAVNKALISIEHAIPEAEFLLQTHDSGAFQTPTCLVNLEFLQRVRAAARIIVPYDDPLEMSCSIKLSSLSWGDVQEVKEDANAGELALLLHGIHPTLGGPG